MRVLTVCVLVAAAFVLVHARADAVTEFCPASVSAFTALHPLHRGDTKADAPASLFAYALSAASARTVTGYLAIETDKGWFTAAFGPSAMQEHDATFYSAPVYVRFPEAVKILHAWVNDASTIDDAASQWAGKGDVGCDPIGFSTVPPSVERQALPPPRTLVAQATAAAAPAGLACARPFADATPVYLAPPQVPQSALAAQPGPIRVEVEVAISASGVPIDAWMVVPSQSKTLNDALLAAVRTSQFRPAIGLCRPVPGTYMLRATFKPH